MAIQTDSKGRRIAWDGQGFCFGFKCNGKWRWQPLCIDFRAGSDADRMEWRRMLARLVVNLRKTGLRFSLVHYRVATGRSNKRV